MKRVSFIRSDISDGISGSTFSHLDKVESIDICRDNRDGKNLITVKIDGELVFSYDSNFKGQSVIYNGIQMPIEEFKGFKE